MTKANHTNDTLTSLLLHADNPDIETRDQFSDGSETPHVAPGWNSIMIQDIITEMFMLEASSRKNDSGNQDHPSLTDDELAECLPGFTEVVRNAAAGNIPSHRLYTALHQEVRDIARAVVSRMDSKDIQALLNRATAKIEETSPE